MPALEAYPVITGIGGALPERRLPNDALIKLTGIDSTHEAIESRTGIFERRWKEDTESGIGFAVTAARRAIENSGVTVGDIHTIINGTMTAEEASPDDATKIHQALQASEECLTTDIGSACAGSVYALRLGANELMANGRRNSTALIVGSNALSLLADRSDRKSVVLFGDGAGAATMQLREDANPVYSHMMTVPDRGAIYAPKGGYIAMDGPEVKKHAAYVFSKSAELTLDKADVDWDGVDFFIPHQANGKMLAAIADEMGVPPEKRIITVDRHGNTSSASIFLAMARAHELGLIKPGRKRILMSAIGAGMVGGSILMDVDLPAFKGKPTL